MLTFTSPQLTSSTGHILSLLFSATYVGSIYVSSKARLSFNHSTNTNLNINGNGYDGGPREKMKEERWRDDPDVIKARLVAVSIATFICCSAVYWLLHSLSSPSFLLFSDLFARLGFDQGLLSLSDPSLDGAWVVLRSHLVTPVLYLGPLYATYLAGTMPGQKCWSWNMHVRHGLLTWQGIRNIIVVCSFHPFYS